MTPNKLGSFSAAIEQEIGKRYSILKGAKQHKFAGNETTR